jgi:hypothetical protein
MRLVKSRALLLLAAGLAMPSKASPQGVYVTAPNNQLLEVNFETGRSKTVVRDNGTNFQGLVVRREGEEIRLVVANGTQGGDIRIYDPKTGAGARIASLKGAHGVALDPSGNIYAVSQQGSKGQVMVVPRRNDCPNQISGLFPAGCFPGGYGAARFIDEDVSVSGSKKGTKALADVRFVRGGAGAGSLVVLAKDPAMILRYDDPGSCTGTCNPVVVAATAQFGSYVPAGIELAPKDEFLVTTTGGAVLRFTKDGMRIATPNFASLLGGGAKLSLGVQDGQNVVFATVRTGGGKVERFEIESDGTGSPAGLVQGLNPPEGVGNVNGGVAITPGGSNVTVFLPTLETIFDNVKTAGLSDAVCHLYDAPSDYDCNNPSDLTLTDLSPALPGVNIPAYVRPFRIGNPATGRCAFFVCELSTTASIGDTITLHEDEEQFLGYEPVCETLNTDPNHEARFFWAPNPDKNEPGIPEGSVFTDISAGCGSNIGRGGSFSYALPAVQDDRSVCTIARYKVDNLQASVADFTPPAHDYIAGACNLGTGAPLPKEAPEDAFTAAGLGAKTRWTVVSGGAQSVWGSGGNGLLPGGGSIQFQVKLAGFAHEFGTSGTDAVGSRTRQVIIANSGTPGAGPFSFTPSSEPYTFYFKNISGYLSGATLFSDGQGLGSFGDLDIAIYRDNDNPGRYALFFDDGPDDDDFDDLVLTATGDIGTACQLQAALEHAGRALAASEDCTDDSEVTTVVSDLQQVVGIVQDNPGDFDNTTRNVSGELQARAESATFMACKEIATGKPAVCPQVPFP